MFAGVDFESLLAKKVKPPWIPDVQTAGDLKYFHIQKVSLERSVHARKTFNFEGWDTSAAI